MSWSVNLIGRPENVVKALNDHSEMLSGQCKLEFDSVKPALVGIVKENFAVEGGGYNQPLIRLMASGSGCAKMPADQGAPLEQVYRQCSVVLEHVHGNLV